MKLRKGFLPEEGGSGYTYTNTRVRVRKTLLLGADDFKKLMKVSLPEIANFLSQGSYRKEIEELGIKFKGVNLIEYALNRNLERTFHKILSFSLEMARRQIRLYLRRYDVQNIKTIIRGKHSKASEERIINELVACGEFTREFLEDVVKKSSSANEAMEFFKDTDYYEILEKYGDDLPALENELDRFHYSQVLEQSEKELKDYVRFEIWVKNTLNRLRYEKHKTQEGAIRLEILPGERPEKTAVALKEDNVETRVLLKKMLVMKGLRMVYEFDENIRPVLGYFIAKENEISNMRIIARGKHTGLPEGMITRHLVM